MKHVHYDTETGKILGFYTKEVHGDNIPSPTLEVTDKKWRELINNPGHTVSDGSLVPPPEPTPPTEEELLEQERTQMQATRFQVKAVLHQEGLLSDVETYMNDADQVTKFAWSDSTTFRRNSPTLNQVANALGWSDTLLDDLFRKAKEIDA